jgi:UDP-N-acetylmuramoyl-tripeptide--D-alanyl-D-alanine ligase
VIPLRLAEVAERCAGRLEAAPSTHEVTGVKIDSRLVEEGDLFVAVGRGVEFVEDARARAAATLVPDDAFVAMAVLGAAVRDRSSARVVAITGSMGKTATKDILAALCTPQARTVAAEASFNNELGVPLTLCRLEEDTEVCILELAMRGFGQIAELCAIARPEIGVVTNVGPVHLELVGDLAGVERAKGELVEALPAGGTAIVPADFPVLRDDVHVVRLHPPEDAVVQDGRTLLGGVSFGFTARHQAANAAAALAALDALGLPPPAEVDVRFSRWRGDELPLPGGGLLINDCYNANPVSMRAALSLLGERAFDRRRVVVLGDMAELGPEAPRFHREVGAAAAELGVQVIVAVGPLARGYLDGAEGIEVARWAPTLELALEAVREVVEPGDCVLVKGSRAMGLEAVVEALAGVAA